VPPLAVRVVLVYASVAVPLGRDAVLITTTPATAIESAWVVLLEAESVRATVKLDVPGPVGVPEIWPVEPLSDSPAGRLPDEMDQAYPLPLPPVAARVVL
jgi:hypothetical protein